MVGRVDETEPADGVKEGHGQTPGINQPEPRMQCRRQLIRAQKNHRCASYLLIFLSKLSAGHVCFKMFFDFPQI